MTDFINRFNKVANFAKHHDMDLTMKLLYNAGLTEQDMKLVLTEIDFKEKHNVYKQAKIGLTKYLRSGSSQATGSPTNRLTAELTEAEEALVVKGWNKPG